ncbi:LytR/AlgR family response regulator transcription factor [Aquimarina brevivitae]|uniref:LytTR family two component transcriptional regulator n=1 Tax=Aquimarina brevivitae TaxID=323412 RepID=A0A4Q7PG46_9FLAO|nr:LytTR family DNA-binding domain-containing protein [Aquimarina brevivitae]RZS99464.1 LytTR family two component transcriptional regulator [Aquimarina brevivitae]
MKTVVIIDDEKDARDLIKQYLTHHPNYKLVGEAQNGLDAVQKINELKPELIFLDIQMPGMNGFEVLTKLQVLPEVIFSTAYDDYALEAFKVKALDYLLKPYGKKRFEEAIQRIDKNTEKVQQLAEKLLKEQSNTLEKIIVHSGVKRLIIDVTDIHYLEAYGDYTKIFTKRESFLSTTGISSILEKLKDSDFIRIHRSHVVNLSHILHLIKDGRYYYLHLTSGTKLKVSETYLRDLKALQL